MKNHEARPTGAASLPEANVIGKHDQSKVKRDDHRGYNNARGRDKDKRRYTNRRGGGHNKRENNMSSQNYPPSKNDDKPGTSQKYDKDVEANLALKDDIFYGLGDITHMKVDDFFGDRN
ncbi:hypothetical protein EJD97_001928 [Solanum chilense]|uniref:Uncharacterized protein n=1 Tax=Solanum chilense TaxID=4083 RepID=A0A6N2C430_SOLCI|nr:hypothetical protein EJD97_001928 [Solanum chilense]